MATTTTTEILAPVLRQPPSDKLKQAINNCSLGFKKLADAIHEALELGQQEGFSSKEVGLLIRQEMISNGFTDRTVRKYLPTEAKMQSKARTQKTEFAAQNSAKLDELGLGLALDNPTQLNHEQLTKLQKAQLIEIIEKLQQFVVSNNNNNNNNDNSKTKSKPKPKPISQIPKKSEKGKPYRGNHQWISNEKLDQILQLHNAGKSSRKISEITGLSKNTVLRRLRLATANTAATTTTAAIN